MMNTSMGKKAGIVLASAFGLVWSSRHLLKKFRKGLRRVSWRRSRLQT